MTNEDFVTTLNNSTRIGKVLYTKEERESLKLPSIYKKNLKKLQKITGDAALIGSGIIGGKRGSVASTHSAIQNTLYGAGNNSRQPYASQEKAAMVPMEEVSDQTKMKMNNSEMHAQSVNKKQMRPQGNKSGAYHE